jgi:hypothetical protein
MPGAAVTDAQPTSSLELCDPCGRPTPLRDLVRGPDGIPINVCRWCAAEAPAALTALDSIGCEPAWSPPLQRRLRVEFELTDTLSDIADYQEQQHG